MHRLAIGLQCSIPPTIIIIAMAEHIHVYLCFADLFRLQALVRQDISPMPVRRMAPDACCWRAGLKHQAVSRTDLHSMEACMHLELNFTLNKHTFNEPHSSWRVRMLRTPPPRRKKRSPPRWPRGAWSRRCRARSPRPNFQRQPKRRQPAVRPLFCGV